MSVWQLCNKCSTEAESSGWELLDRYDKGAWDCMTCAGRATQAWHESGNDGIIGLGLVR